MRIFPCVLLLMLPFAMAGAAEAQPPDPAFVAKVEAALATIRTRTGALADQEFSAIQARAEAHAVVTRIDSRIDSMVALALTAVKARAVNIQGCDMVALRMADSASAEAAIRGLGADGFLVDAWIFIVPGRSLPEVNAATVTLALGARHWNPTTKQLGDSPTAADQAAFEQRVATQKMKNQDWLAFQDLRQIAIAEVQVQSGAYFDDDADGRGEYAFPGDMANTELPGRSARLSFLPADFTGDSPVHGGRRFAVFLPGADLTSAVATRAATQALGNRGINEREMYYVIYSWPATGSTGTLQALDVMGKAWQRPWDGTAPAWNTLWAAPEKPWTGTPAAPWTKVERY